MPFSMPTYAILGATGATGSRIAKFLLDRNDVHVNLYARSADKLTNTIPDVSKMSNASCYIGALSDHEKIVSCLDGASVVFGTLAQNANQPTVSIARDQARAIVTALESLRASAQRAGREWSAPKVVFLAAATLDANGPTDNGLGGKFIYRANHYVYEDLRLAFEYIKSEAPWLEITVACPRAIVDSPPEGFELSSTEGSLTLSYDDLAQAMVAMVEDSAWVGRYVTIKSKGPPRYSLLAKSLFQYILPGHVVTTFPGSFRPLRWLGFLP